MSVLFRLTQAMSLVDRLEVLRDIKVTATKAIKVLETAAVLEMNMFENTVRYQDMASQTQQIVEHVEDIGNVAAIQHTKAEARKKKLEKVRAKHMKKQAATQARIARRRENVSRIAIMDAENTGHTPPTGPSSSSSAPADSRPPSDDNTSSSSESD